MKEGLEKYFEEGKVDLENQGLPEVQEEQQEVVAEDQAPIEGQAEEIASAETDVQTEQQEVPEEVVAETEESPLEVIQTLTEEEVQPEVAEVKQELNLPEGVDKLIAFMEDTGGTLQDYVNLNKSFDDLSEDALLKEYYLKTKPHLDGGDINFLINKKFTIDEEEMEEDEVRERKIALKEELSKAKNYLNGAKDKYYAELKATGRTTSVNEEAKAKQEAAFKHFQQETNKIFEGLEGFDFAVGDKSLRYKVGDVGNLKETQLDINNVIGKYFDGEGNLTDALGYHKALWAAQNADNIAKRFYAQGKADAIEERTKDSKNIDFDHTTQPPSSNTKLKPGMAREIENPTINRGQRVNLKHTKF